MTILHTERLELRPVTLPVVIAVLEGKRRTDIEAMLGAELPWSWPSRALLEQSFRASLEEIRRDPETRLWGDRLMITREVTPRVVGSVVFHGRPRPDGECELAFGVEDAYQRQGFASEGVRACLDWALAQPECRVVVVNAMRWDKASLRLLAKLGATPREGAVTPKGEDFVLYEKRRPE